MLHGEEWGLKRSTIESMRYGRTKVGHFFLNSVVSQMCLNQSTYRRPPDMPSYIYPYYTDDRSKTVFCYKSPLAYLIDLVFTSFSRMWVTLFLVSRGCWYHISVSYLLYTSCCNYVARSKCDVELTTPQDSFLADWAERKPILVRMYNAFY